MKKIQYLRCAILFFGDETNHTYCESNCKSFMDFPILSSNNVYVRISSEIWPTLI